MVTHARRATLGERLRRLLRPPRRLEFTREGKYFVGITLGVGFAAINTGNNLLYLLLGMMLSLIIASGVLSEMSLRGLSVSREPPPRPHAGKPFLMGVSLQNHKRRLPSFSIEVEDLLEGLAIDKKCYFLKLPAGRLQHTSYRHSLPRRGRYTFTGFRLSTKFPFGLFRKSRVIALTDETIVYPQLVSVGHPPRPRGVVVGEQMLRRLGRRGDFHGLHAFREGEDPRDIHWRTSAKKGRAMVREHEDESARRMTILLDNAVAGGDAEGAAALERAISLAASLAAYYLAGGFRVRLAMRGQGVPWLEGGAELLVLLRVLALLPAASPETPWFAFSDEAEEPILVLPRGAPRPRPGHVVEA